MSMFSDLDSFLRHATQARRSLFNRHVEYCPECSPTGSLCQEGLRLEAAAHAAAHARLALDLESL